MTHPSARRPGINTVAGGSETNVRLPVGGEAATDVTFRNHGFGNRKTFRKAATVAMKDETGEKKKKVVGFISCLVSA